MPLCRRTGATIFSHHCRATLVEGISASHTYKPLCICIKYSTGHNCVVDAQMNALRTRLPAASDEWVTVAMANCWRSPFHFGASKLGKHACKHNFALSPLCNKHPCRLSWKACLAHESSPSTFHLPGWCAEIGHTLMIHSTQYTAQQSGLSALRRTSNVALSCFAATWSRSIFSLVVQRKAVRHMLQM